MTAVPGVPVEGVTFEDLLADRRDEWADLILEHMPVIHRSDDPLTSWLSCTACEFETSEETDDVHDDGRSFGLHVLSFIETDIAAALPLLREAIAAEVLTPVRALADGWASKSETTWALLEAGATSSHVITRANVEKEHADAVRAALSAPVQAATNGCDICGAPSTHVTTPGGMRGCDDHFTGGRS